MKDNVTYFLVYSNSFSHAFIGLLYGENSSKIIAYYMYIKALRNVRAVAAVGN